MDYNLYQQILEDLSIDHIPSNIKYDPSHYETIKYKILTDPPWGSGSGFISGIPEAWNSGNNIETPSGILLARLIYDYWTNIYAEPS